MGVCCIVFDIDGMLFEFLFSIFHVFLAFYAIHATSVLVSHDDNLLPDYSHSRIG